MHFIVLSHLRWNFVYQRPQHLLSRCARENQVWFWEEPVFVDGIEARLAMRRVDPNLTVIVPELPAGIDEEAISYRQQLLMEELLNDIGTESYVLWYYTPMARNFTRQLSPAAVVYDCMDELSAFRGAPLGLRVAEQELFEAADVVFTGGRSLFESKRARHHSVYCFTSSIDVRHFGQARKIKEEAVDQRAIPHPRVGYCGVIDERMDLELLAAVAESHPEWHLVMIGPVVKISESDLPRRANIHYLGGKNYAELPLYMAGWDAAMLPFARNESTRFISPTKTPEYLAAGLPVVSTSITDVVRPYGRDKLVQIADTPEEFSAALARCLQKRSLEEEQLRLQKVDAFLSRSSWDQTWSDMEAIVRNVVERKAADAGGDADRLELSTTAD